jgi:hypothetical protein
MRVNNQLTRIIVLSFFILCISAFVAYRSGAFDRVFGARQTNPEPAFSSFGKDTVKPPKTDTTEWKKTIMSSSKSIIVIEDKNMVTDSFGKKPKDSSFINNKRSLPSSKSGRIISPADLKPVNSSDSNKKIRKDTVQRTRTIMPGSKSGILVFPKDTVRKNQ